MNTKIILAVVLAIVVIAAWAVNAHRNKGFKIFLLARKESVRELQIVILASCSHSEGMYLLAL